MINKKGFTLIELITVLTILSIIALITVPILGNTINKYKLKADMVRVQKYVSALEAKLVEDDEIKLSASIKYLLKADSFYKDADEPLLNVVLSLKGSKPSDGYVIFDDTAKVISYGILVYDSKEYEYNDGKITYLNKVPYNPKAPKITTRDYPIIMLSHVDVVKIEYDDNKNCKGYFSVDNGTTWTLYNGQAINNTNVMAKSICRGEHESSIVREYGTQVANDSPSYLTYDKISTTNGSSTSYKYYVDEETWGKILYVKKTQNYPPVMTFYDKGGNVLSTKQTSETELIIPDKTYSILYTRNGGYADAYLNIYEIRVEIEPIFKFEFHYPKIKIDGVDNPYMDVKIEKTLDLDSEIYYHLDDGIWKKYEDSISLLNNQTVYAKTVYNNMESVISSYTASFPDDVPSEVTYDGDSATGDYTPECAYFKFNIDSKAWGKTLYFEKDTSCTPTVSFYNDLGSLISGSTTYNSSFSIPNNSYTVMYKRSGESPDCGLKLYGVKIQ